MTSAPELGAVCCESLIGNGSRLRHGCVMICKQIAHRMAWPTTDRYSALCTPCYRCGSGLSTMASPNDRERTKQCQRQQLSMVIMNAYCTVDALLWWSYHAMAMDTLKTAVANRADLWSPNGPADGLQVQQRSAIQPNGCWRQPNVSQSTTASKASKSACQLGQQKHWNTPCLQVCSLVRQVSQPKTK